MSFPPPSVQESFCGIWNHNDDSGATFSRAGKVLQFSPALSTRLAAVLKHAIKKITRSLYSTKQGIRKMMMFHCVCLDSRMSRSHTVFAFFLLLLLKTQAITIPFWGHFPSGFYIFNWTKLRVKCNLERQVGHHLLMTALWELNATLQLTTFKNIGKWKKLSILQVYRI